MPTTRAVVAAAFVAIAGCFASAAPAGAASGDWGRAWGKNVNGGGVFGVCTVAASCQTGTAGGLGGEMNIAAGVAVDSSGNVYAVDQANHRIQKFNSVGNWERAWGKNVNGGGVFGICTVAASCQAGQASEPSTAPGGEMNTPVAVATDSASNVYVVDAFNHRIQKFDSSGNWLRAWGKNVNGGGVFGVCTVAANCQSGSTGSLGGEMDIPKGIATDSADDVYVVEQNQNRVQRFDSSGTWERAWGKNVNGGGVFGVCTVAANCQAGGMGGLGGEMNIPFGIGTDTAGNVYVADGHNQRIQKFDSSGTWERAWGKNVNGGGVFGVCTVAASCQAGTTGGLAGEMSSPAGVATDSAGNVYVPDFNNERIQRFTSTGSWERAWGKGVNGGTVFGICTVAANCQAGSLGGRGGEMDGPSGVATNPAGHLFVSEWDNNRVQRFLNPAPTVTTQATASATIGSQISDQATLSGGESATGTITFSAYGPSDPTCANSPAYTSNAITVSGNGVYSNAPAFTPATAGTYRWRVSYSGDPDNVGVSTACNAPNQNSVVNKATTTVTSEATANVTIGSQISNQATLSGGSSPTGYMSFHAYGPNNPTCAGAPAYVSDPIPVSGNGAYNNTPAFTPISAGTYHWKFFYSGNANNTGIETPCNDTSETSVVGQLTPTLTAQATANATLGGQISSQATLSDGYSPTGSITFTAYGPDDAGCANPPAYTSGPVPVSGNAAYANAPAFAPGAAGTYRWRASYSGDANNVAVLMACNDPNQTSLVGAAADPPSLLPPVVPSMAAASTGQRAAALKRCARKKGAARKKCIKRARKLPA